jgi:hypothetical protein
MKIVLNDIKPDTILFILVSMLRVGMHTNWGEVAPDNIVNVNVPVHVHVNEN